MESLPASDYSILFINTSGQKVYSHQVKNFRGSAVLPLNLPALPKGLYTVQLEGKDGKYFEKLMVQ